MSSLFPEIVLASNNQGKLKEFKKFFEPYHIQVIPQGELNIPEAEEPFNTFIENALAKARHASRLSGKPALADDSGICATALNGQPGIHSARYAGIPKSDSANNEKLTNALKPFSNKQVWYTCSLVLIRHAEDPSPIIAEGVWEGEWLDEPRVTNQNGFGYDPHFYLPEYKLTVGEISTTLKNRIGHRGRALIELMHKLDELYHRAGLPVPEIPHFVPDELRNKHS